MAKITIDNFVKHYGEVKAVRGVSFEIADGEFVSLLGPSGMREKLHHALDRRT